MYIIIGLAAIAIVGYVAFKQARRAANNAVASKSVKVLVTMNEARGAMNVTEITDAVGESQVKSGIIVQCVAFLLRQGYITSNRRVANVLEIADDKNHFSITPKGRRYLRAQ